MQQERRRETRRPIDTNVYITFANGARAESRIMNMNLGGCFLDGSFGLQGGDVVFIQSAHNPAMNGIYAQVQWIVDDPTLKGFGVQFQPMDDAQKFELIKWFNKLMA